jgi:two-component system response regulator AlgR
MADQALKVLIADDEPLAAERLQLLLAKVDGIDLVGTATDGESTVRMSEALGPDLLLLDIAMPGLDGIGVARAARFRRLPHEVVHHIPQP